MSRTTDRLATLLAAWDDAEQARLTAAADSDAAFAAAALDRARLLEAAGWGDALTRDLAPADERRDSGRAAGLLAASEVPQVVCFLLAAPVLALMMAGGGLALYSALAALACGAALEPLLWGRNS